MKHLALAAITILATISTGVHPVSRTQAQTVHPTLTQALPGHPGANLRSGGYLAPGSRKGATRRARKDGCPAPGQWPGPDGIHYLNRFTDGGCGYVISSNTLSPTTLTSLDSGSWYIEAPITVAAGTTVTVTSGATIADGNAGNPLNRNGGSITVNGTLEFQSGSAMDLTCPSTASFACGIYVRNGGTLTAAGIAANGVNFSAAGPGSWGGIYFASGSTGGLSYVHLSDAGGLLQTSAAGRFSAIIIDNATVAIDHSTIDDSGGDGIEITDTSAGRGAPTVTSLTLNDNAGFGIRYDFLASTLDKVTDLDMSGNGHDGVGLVYGGFQAYTINAVWPNFGVPIIVENLAGVAKGAQLTVAPGTTIRFGTGYRLAVSGTLLMNGTPTAPITLTAEGSTSPGAWGGVYFASGSAGSLSYVHLSYTGSILQCGCGPRYTAIEIDGASPTVTHTTIDNSSGNDVEVGSGGKPVLSYNNLLAVPDGFSGVAVDNSASGQPLVSAQRNWWGDISGPTSPGNSGGVGTPATAGVNYAKWLCGPAAPFAVPCAPINPTAVAGNQKLTASWSPPTSTGGKPVTSYVVTIYSGISATVVKTPQVGTAACKLTNGKMRCSTVVAGLTNGKAYSATVAAINVQGTGPASKRTPTVIPHR